MSIAVRAYKPIVWVALFFIAVTVAAFFPNIITDTTIYGVVRIVVFAFLLVMTLLCSSFRSLKNGYIRAVFLQFLLITVMILFFQAIGFSASRTDIVILLITVWAICIGYSMRLDEADLHMLLFAYGALTVLLGLLTMYYFVGSVTLTDYMYMIDTKNMVGQIVATGGIGLVTITFASKKNRVAKLSLLAISAVLIFVLRCRTATAAFLVYILLLVWRMLSRRQAFYLTLACLVLIALFHTSIIALLEEVFIGATDISDLDSVSAGRMERNIGGIDFFMSHPLFGELRTESGLPNIHNYVIKRLAGYGVFATPFIILFVYMLVVVIKQCWHADFKDIQETGSLMMIIPFFSSMLEPLSPFGPGLVQLVPFFFYGISLQKYASVRR